LRRREVEEFRRVSETRSLHGGRLGLKVESLNVEGPKVEGDGVQAIFILNPDLLD
jgi:hypothetical protein